MTSLPKPLPAVKSDAPGERDLLLSGLRVAATRSRLQTNLFDTLGIALRQKQVDCAGVLKWLADENLLEHVPFGPGVAR
jgi:hypothetical protein